MRRWDSIKKDWVERPDLDTFLAEVEEVCRRNGFTISHEDSQGAFEIVEYNRELGEWLLLANARVERTPQP